MMLRRNNLNWGRFTNPNENISDLLRSNIQESFARTAMEIVKSGRPFSEVITTERYQMTTALMMFHAFLEQRYVNDRNQLRQVAMPEVTRFTIYRNAADAPSPADALDPNNARFMHFYTPGFDDLCLPNNQNTFDVDQAAFGGNDEIYYIFSQIVGRPERVFNRGANNSCRSVNNVRTTPILTRSDFSDWREVRFRRVNGNDALTRFYNLDALRSANELAVRSERLGFFTTLGFLRHLAHERRQSGSGHAESDPDHRARHELRRSDGHRLLAPESGCGALRPRDGLLRLPPDPGPDARVLPDLVQRQLRPAG